MSAPHDPPRLRFGPVALAGAQRDEARALLALAVGRPTAERLDALLAGYERPGHRLFGLTDAGVVVGVIGLAGEGPASATILHIATAPGSRGRGLGRHLIAASAAALGVRELVAETDQDAVGFYARLGFTTTPIPSAHPGAARFACRLRLAPHLGNVP